MTLYDLRIIFRKRNYSQKAYDEENKALEEKARKYWNDGFKTYSELSEILGINWDRTKRLVRLMGLDRWEHEQKPNKYDWSLSKEFPKCTTQTYEEYKHLARYGTTTVIRKYWKLIDPDDIYEPGLDSVDHMFSIYDGFHKFSTPVPWSMICPSC